MSPLEAIAYGVSRQSRMLSLETITYVVSQSDHVRRLSRWSRNLFLEVVTYVVSHVALAPETWLRDAGYVCTVRAYRVVKGFSMGAILPFAFEVQCEGFFGQACVTCTHVHVHMYT